MAFALTDSMSKGKHVVSRQLKEGEDSVLLHLRSGYVYTCGEVGTCIWKTLEKPIAVGAILEKVCAEFDVASAAALADLQKFLGELVAEQLLSVNAKSHA